MPAVRLSYYITYQSRQEDVGQAGAVEDGQRAYDHNESDNQPGGIRVHLQCRVPHPGGRVAQAQERTHQGVVRVPAHHCHRLLQLRGLHQAGPILYKKYVGILGQLNGLLLIDLIAMVAVGVEMIDLQFYILAGARLVMGFVLGISTAIIPVYINSITPPSTVGRLGTYNQLLITMGAVVSYSLGSIILDDPADQIRWRVYLGMPAFFLLLRVLVLQLFYRFNTLERHIDQKQDSKLSQYCLMVYGNGEQEMVEEVAKMKSFKKLSQQNSSTLRRRLIVGLLVIGSNQLTGINAISYYARQLFNKITEGDTEQSQLLVIILALTQVIATLISSRFVDRLGRKSLILGGQIFIAACLLAIFIFDELLSQTMGAGTANVFIILLIFLHLIGNNMTVGPCCIIYCTQILEDITWIIITLKGLALLVALTSEYMIQYIGLGFMFLIFFFLTLLIHLLLRTRMRETKAFPTSQIYASFAPKDTQSLLEPASERSSLIE